MRSKARAHASFFADNKPPYMCAVCDEEVLKLTGGQGDSLVVHHEDENPSNNASSNLRAMHRACHAKHHHAGVSKSEEHRAKISAAHRGKRLSEVHRAKLSSAKAGKPGHPVDMETRRKISATKLSWMRDFP